MPATGLKIVGTGACLPWCSISSSFQNSLKTSWHRGYEFLEFWCWNLVPFLPDIGFQLLKSLWSSLTYFSFNDAPNVLYRWKIWTAGRPIQHPDSSTTKPCCCNMNEWMRHLYSALLCIAVHPKHFTIIGLLGGHDWQVPVEGIWPGHRGYTPTLYEKCHGIFNDHR